MVQETEMTLTAPTGRTVLLVSAKPLRFVLFMGLRFLEGYVGMATGGVLFVTTTFHLVRGPISAA